MRIGDPVECWQCGNSDGEKIFAIPREHETRIDGRVQFRHWWKCGACKFEWKAGPGNPSHDWTHIGPAHSLSMTKEKS